jgi:hypothetical protein
LHVTFAERQSTSNFIYSPKSIQSQKICLMVTFGGVPDARYPLPLFSILDTRVGRRLNAAFA